MNSSLGSLGSLKSRLASINSQHRATRIPTSLADFLYIYSASRYESYVDYMKGAKATVKYLAPIELPEVPETFITPELLRSYTVQNLAELLADTSGASATRDLTVIAAWVRAIIYTELMSASGKDKSLPPKVFDIRT